LSRASASSHIRAISVSVRRAASRALRTQLKACLAPRASRSARAPRDVARASVW
jgi:hypothetical protein